MHVSILVPEGTASVAVTGPMDILNEANKFYKQTNPSSKKPFFDVELVSLNKRRVKCLSNYSLDCNNSIQRLKKTDLILVSNITGDFEQGVKKNMGFVSWINVQYKLGADIGAFCTGTFLLAATGLLDNKRATTHWMAVDAFRKMFPRVKLLPDKIITDEGRLYCAGGSTSFFNLVLYVIEKYCGHEVAVLISKSMLIDMDKVPQSVYAIFSTQKNHGDDEILKVQNYIEENFDVRIWVDDLIGFTALSRRSLIRRFKAATGNTPQEYIQRVKVENARKRLEFEKTDIQQIAYDLGYDDPRAFRTIFFKHMGISPRAYRNKYKVMALR